MCCMSVYKSWGGAACSRSDCICMYTGIYGFFLVLLLGLSRISVFVASWPGDSRPKERPPSLSACLLLVLGKVEVLIAAGSRTSLSVCTPRETMHTPSGACGVLLFKMKGQRQRQRRRCSLTSGCTCIACCTCSPC